MRNGGEGKENIFIAASLAIIVVRWRQISAESLLSRRRRRCSLLFQWVFKSVKLNKAFSGKYLQLIFNRSLVSAWWRSSNFAHVGVPTHVAPAPPALFMLPVVSRALFRECLELIMLLGFPIVEQTLCIENLFLDDCSAVLLARGHRRCCFLRERSHFKVTRNCCGASK